MDRIGRGVALLSTLATVLVCALLLPSGPLRAQEQEGPTGALKGRVVDGDTRKPLEGATVALWKETAQDSTLITGTVTGKTGAFSFTELPIDSYTVRVSYVGYSDRSFRDMRPGQNDASADMGTIVLTPETAQAEGVEVTADRPAVQLQTDRTVYNTSERAVSAGGSARTVLETLPSIQIDIDGSISYRGNESVALHINGEPASLQGETLVSYLQSLPASAVQRVEIIPNPSAKYEPEGMAGIINIVLERDLDTGWGGGVTLGARADANARYGGNGSVNLGYQSETWRAVTTYAYRRGGEEDEDSRFVERFAENEANTLIDQTGTEEELEQSHSVTSRVDYNVAETTSLGFEGTFSVRRDRSDGQNIERWYTASMSGVPDSTNARVLDENRNDETVDGRLSFDHAFVEDEHTLNLDLRYDRDFETEDNTYRNYVLGSGGTLGPLRDRQFDTVNEDEQDGSLELDYARPLGPVSLETGYKGSLRRLDSDQTFEGDERAFTFDERIHAAYGILSDEWGNFKVETGLRAEAVNTDFALSSEGETTKSEYVSFYPSAFVTYEPSKRQQARLSYSKRVDRPNLWDINPIEDNENPTFRERGNPGLEPEYIHSVELTVTRRWGLGSMTLSPYLRHTVNEIEEIETEETINGRTVTVRQAQNLASSTSYGTELITTFNWNDRVEGTVSGNLYRSVTDGSNLSTDLSNDALTVSTRANVRGKIRDGLQLELSQFYRPARDIPGGRISRFTSTELAVQQELFEGDGSLTLRIDDLFNQSNINIYRETTNFYQESNFQWGARSYSLTFQYTFGNNPEERGDRGGGDFDGGGGPGGR